MKTALVGLVFATMALAADPFVEALEDQHRKKLEHRSVSRSGAGQRHENHQRGS